MPGVCLRLTTSAWHQTSVGRIRPVTTRVHNVDEEINLKRFAAVDEGVLLTLWMPWSVKPPSKKVALDVLFNSHTPNHHRQSQL